MDRWIHAHEMNYSDRAWEREGTFESILLAAGTQSDKILFFLSSSDINDQAFLDSSPSKPRKMAPWVGFPLNPSKWLEEPFPSKIQRP